MTALEGRTAAKRAMAARHPVTVDVIQHAVAAYYQTSVSALLGESRERVHVRPRQVAMYLTKKLVNISFPKIGAKFKRDHSTVYVAINFVQNTPELLHQAHDIEEMLAQTQDVRAANNRRPAFDLTGDPLIRLLAERREAAARASIAEIEFEDAKKRFDAAQEKLETANARCLKIESEISSQLEAFKVKRESKA